MSKIVEVLEILAKNGTVTYLQSGIDLAKEIDAVYTGVPAAPESPQEWANKRANQYRNRKINFIKDIRAEFGLSLKESKDIAETASSLLELRDKLVSTEVYPNENPWEQYDYEEPPF